VFVLEKNIIEVYSGLHVAIDGVQLMEGMLELVECRFCNLICRDRTSYCALTVGDWFNSKSVFFRDWTHLHEAYMKRNAIKNPATQLAAI